MYFDLALALTASRDAESELFGRACNPIALIHWFMGLDTCPGARLSICEILGLEGSRVTTAPVVASLILASACGVTTYISKCECFVISGTRRVCSAFR